jgi:hypothetical protein
MFENGHNKEGALCEVWVRHTAKLDSNSSWLLCAGKFA